MNFSLLNLRIWPHIPLVGGLMFSWYHKLQGRPHANLASPSTRWDKSCYHCGYVMHHRTYGSRLWRFVSCINHSWEGYLLITTLTQIKCYGSHLTIRCQDLGDLPHALEPNMSRRVKKGSRYLYVSGRTFDNVVFQGQKGL